MSNPATVSGFVGSGTTRNTFPLQTVAATAETILKINTDTGTSNYFLVLPTGGNVYGAQTVLDVNGNPAITQFSGREYGLPSGETVDEFSSSSWNGHPFKIRVVGTGTAGHNAGQTLVFNLYQGTSATLGSDKIIGTTGSAYAIATSTVNVAFDWMIEATLNWNATSQVLSGSYTANVSGGTTSQFTTPTVITNVVTGVTAAGLSFLATVTLGNAASSTIQITEFVADKL
jgi:hypothetical protein